MIGCSRETPEWTLKNYEHFNADVSDEAQVRPIFKHISSKYKRLDHLINNAGVASMNHSMLMTIDTVRSIIDTNVIGTFIFSQEAARIMQKNNFGRIVNFSTIAVPLKLAGAGVYAASKSAVESMTHILAKEFAEFGITVNTFGPNGVATDLIRGVTEEKMKRIHEKLAIPRNSTFEDVSNTIDYFLKKESAMVTGQTIYLGGV